ncbi:MAG: LysR family transcriptional regulator [Kofleriaceae bacterium]
MTAPLRDLWNWLPAFVAIADAGSVVGAARQLALTPAAVSRTLGLLEGALDVALFNRVGRRLVLNPTGAALRDAVRVGMTQVDAALRGLAGDPMAGRFRVGSIGVLTDHFVVPALIDLARAHPAMVPEHVVLRAAEANLALVRGEVDVAFYYEQLSADGLLIERLGSTPMAVYCGRGHPLFGTRRVTRAQVLAHPFSVPQLGDTGRTLDGWPADVPRQVGMRITMLGSNLQVCRAGLMLTVLPDVTAAADVAAGRVRRLAFDPLPPIEVFAARPVDGRSQRAGALIDEVRIRLAARPGGRRGTATR